jgi:septation ring formation regulator EzrA
MTTDPKAIADAAAREGHRLYSEAQLKLSECEDHLAAIIQRHIEPLVGRVKEMEEQNTYTRIQLAVEKHYSEFGRQWQADSSLERWFPITANGYRKLQAERDQLKKENTALRAIVAIVSVLGGAIVGALVAIYCSSVSP